MSRAAMPLVMVVALPLLVGQLAGCGGEEEKKPVVQAKKAPPPPPPPVTSVEQLCQELQIDSMRVRLSEDDAPNSTDARRGILIFFDAWLRGDDQTVMGMLDRADRSELMAMVDDGTWQTATEDVDAIFIRTGMSNTGDRCVLAIYEVGIESQPQLWTYSGGGNSMTFEAVPTPPGMMDRLSGDMISGWYSILQEEGDLWNVPDEQLDDLMAEEDEEEEKSGSGAVGLQGQGGGKGGGGGRRGPAGGDTPDLP
jgi:hypothetical protein